MASNMHDIGMGGNVQQPEDITSDQLEMYIEIEKKKQEASQKLYAGTAEAYKKTIDIQNKYYKEQAAKIENNLTYTREQKLKLIADLRLNVEKQTGKMAQRIAETNYKTATLYQKKLLNGKEREFNLERKEKAAIAKQEAKTMKSGNSKFSAIRKAAQEERTAAKASLDFARKESKLSIAESKRKDIYSKKQRAAKRKDAIEQLESEEEQLKATETQYEQEKAFIKDRTAEILKDDALMKELRGNNANGLTDEQLAKRRAEKETGKTEDEINSDLDELTEALKENAKEQKAEKFGKALEEAGKKALGHALTAMVDGANKALDDAMDLATQYSSKISTRLLGTEENFVKLTDSFKDQLALSPYVTQKKVLESLDKAVDEGIAYNIEQRAFLASITDKIVTTFDAFDSNLMRLIRLQQADTTAARMGLEASLNKFFNIQFADTSYLTDGFDTVSQALLDANSQMTRDMSLSFEYNVQKWLGSLASLGFGTDTIQTIASGINYLGSGNVKELTENEQLNSLMAIAASRSGESYSDMLVNGINDSQANNLLKAMVGYLKEIADSDNQVVKSAFGDVFNLTQSDFRALKNLDNDSITRIYNSSMDYSKAISKTQHLMNTMSSRMTMGEMVDNIFDNFMYTAAEDIVNNPVTALMYKTLNAIEGVTGGLDIMPFLEVWGFGLDFDVTLEGLLKAGMFGISALSNIGNMASSISSGGGSDLSAWDFAAATPRGGEASSLDAGASTTRSLTMGVATASESDTKQGALSDTEEDQESAKQNSKEMSEDEMTLTKLWEKVGVADVAIRTVPIIPDVVNVYDEKNDLRLATITALMTKDNNVKIVDMSDSLKSYLKPKDTVGLNQYTIESLKPSSSSSSIIPSLGSSTKNQSNSPVISLSEDTLDDIASKLSIQQLITILTELKEYVGNG